MVRGCVKGRGRGETGEKVAVVRGGVGGGRSEWLDEIVRGDGGVRVDWNYFKVIDIQLTFKSAGTRVSYSQSQIMHPMTS